MRAHNYSYMATKHNHSQKVTWYYFKETELFSSFGVYFQPSRQLFVSFKYLS